MLSLLCSLPFGVFAGQHIFHQFLQQPFFSAHICQQFFFLTFVATHFFSLAPPPPQISNSASLSQCSVSLPSYTSRQVYLYRMFFAVFSVNSQSILMKFCKDYLGVTLRQQCP